MVGHKLTVISHFYNEEFLLPFWLRHHRNIFDHGVMINYQSTDRSCEIIKELVPDWTLVDTRNTRGWVDPGHIDSEVMDTESWISNNCRHGNCWKMALNTTEFLFHWNLHEYIEDAEKRMPGTPGIRASCIRMVDKPEDKNSDVDYDKHLCLQKTTGWYEREDVTPHVRTTQPRARLLHRHINGQYNCGRHGTRHGDVIQDPNLYLLWFNYSPYKHLMPRGISYRTKQWFDCIHAGTVHDHEPGSPYGPRFPDCYEQQWEVSFEGIHRLQPVRELLEHDPHYKSIYDKIATSFKW